ncbi:hypothetical protein GQ457_13G017720 [Hibiscus cannabinus]
MVFDFGRATENFTRKFNAYNVDDPIEGSSNASGEINETINDPNSEAIKFYRLLQEVEQNLYPGCEDFSKLSFIVQILNFKCLYSVSAKAIDALLKILVKAFPKGNKLPSSFADCKKITQDLGLTYVKIDACVNDCILYRKKYENAKSCPTCGESRWKNGDKSENKTNQQGQRKMVAQKILRYFPITSRLQRLYMSSKIAKEMTWHKQNPCSDGSMRHPADSEVWKNFDILHPSFAADPRNIRLGLASDGFNPFSNMSSSYSVWPVVLIPYSLPPWMCMKDPYFMMSLIIPGPKAPGNDIDVFLEPLIDELNQLWEKGVETYDAFSKNNFQLHAALLWTINDFPAYANLSGWSTKGKLACPTCNMDTSSYRLRHGRKTCYLAHRRFLPLSHSWRNNAKSFDGTKERRCAPKQLHGDDVIEQYKQFSQVTFGKSSRKRKRDEIPLLGNWKKKSIFFELPYWRTLKLRHNLDVMHIEKNVCDNVLGTLLNIEGKTKDNINARFDLECMGIRPELHATSVGDGSMHKEKLKREDTRNIEKRHAKEFHQWFKNHVCQLYDEGSELVNSQLFNLACGPDKRVFRYTSYLINGWRFNTKERDLQLKSQNSGVFVKGDESTGNLDYYGVLTDIIQLNYPGDNSVVLFKADWWDVYHKARFKEDKFGFSMVNVTRRLRTEEPYVLASQAEQVYYVKDIKDLNWQVAVKTKPRDLYDLPCEDVREEPCQENEGLGFRFQEFNVGNDDDDVVSLDRPQLGSTHIEKSLVNLDVIIGAEDEGDESDHDEFTSINNEDDELESINDVDAYNDDDDDDDD